MKKLGKKLSFLTKIMLVVGLLISNLSSLSVVFAYEVSDSMLIDLVNDKLKISYTDALAEDVENVSVKVYENYTYLNGLSEEEVVSSYSLDANQMEAALEGNLELEYESIFTLSEGEEVDNLNLFDGTYEVKVEFIKVTAVEEESTSQETGEAVLEEETEVVAEVTETVLEGENEETEGSQVELLNETLPEVTEEVFVTGEFKKEIKHESGLSVKLFNSENVELTLENNKYLVKKDNSAVVVSAQLLSGGLNPTDVFVYDEVEYMAKDLLKYEFRTNTDFAGYLYGEYVLPVEVKLLKTTNVEEEYDEVVYTDSVSVMYESYGLNTETLNNAVASNEYEDTYLFEGETAEGVLFVLPQFEVKSEETETTRTMLDLYNVLNTSMEEYDAEKVTYQLLKGEVNVLEAYAPASEEDTLEDYLATMMLDETVVVVLNCSDLKVTYRVVFAADLNNDKTITEEDLLKLIDQVVGESEVVDLSKSDVYSDNKVNTLDVLYLNEMIKSKTWNPEVTEVEAELGASLNVLIDGVDALASGDEFTVEYVLSLSEYEVNGFSGLLEYDKEALELVSVSSYIDWLGNYSKDTGKFLYLGEESLTGPELTEDPETEETPENEVTVVTEEENSEVTEEPEVVTEDYVVLTATFKALKAGTHTVTVKDNEYFNNATYLVLAEDLVASVDVVVNKSDDNTLSYLEVAGQVIALVEGKFEYEVSVDNDVTLVDLKYIVSNVAANVTSTVFPEELVEGKNTVVVTVMSESGVSQDYTITVVREAAPVEETTTQVSYDNYEEEEEPEVVVTPESEEEEEEVVEEDEESNLSKIVIIILILLVIAGLVYLIFKDEDSEETKKANKDVDRLKKEALDKEVKTTTVETVSNTKSTNKSNNKSNNNKTKNNKNNNKKER